MGRGGGGRNRCFVASLLRLHSLAAAMGRALAWLLLCVTACTVYAGEKPGKAALRGSQDMVVGEGRCPDVVRRRALSDPHWPAYGAEDAKSLHRPHSSRPASRYAVPGGGWHRPRSCCRCQRATDV